MGSLLNNLCTKHPSATHLPTNLVQERSGRQLVAAGGLLELWRAAADTCTSLEHREAQANPRLFENCLKERRKKLPQKCSQNDATKTGGHKHGVPLRTRLTCHRRKPGQNREHFEPKVLPGLSLLVLDKTGKL